MSDIVAEIKSEFTKNEWWRICQIACPKMARSEFDRLWVEFIAMKRWGMLKDAVK